MAKFPTYEEMGKKVAEEALDEFLYDGKSIREWMQIIASKDAISKQAVFEQIGGWIASGEYEFTNATDYLSKRIKAIPPVSSSEKPKSEWEHDHEILKAYSDGASAVLESLIEQYEHYLELLDADMKDGSATIVTKTKYAVYTEVVKQLKEVLESEDKA